jgi:hypothetical protein
MIKPIPPYAVEVLKKIQDYDRDAILVGGFLRDLWHGLDPKDLDIVVKHSTDPWLIFEALNGTDYDIDTIESSRQDINFSFEARFNVPIAPIPVNLIGACAGQSPLEKLKSHDFGLCQIWCDGQGLHTTKHYDHDVHRKVFSLQRCRSQDEWEAVKTHYFRLQRKYPWPMEISPEFMEAIHKGFPSPEDEIPC